MTLLSFYSEQEQSRVIAEHGYREEQDTGN